MKKALTLLLSIALALALFPAVSLPAAATLTTANDVAAAIEAFSSANGGGLYVELVGSTITVTGALANVTSPLALKDISQSVTIEWNADLTSTNANFHLITLSTTGGAQVTFNVMADANISYGTDGSGTPTNLLAAILIDDDSRVSLSVNGATISASASGAAAIAVMVTPGGVPKADVTINDGAVTAEGSTNPVAIYAPDGSVRVLGGAVTSKGRDAIAISAAHGVAVTNATVEATGEDAVAISAMNTTTILNATVIASGTNAAAISTIVAGGINVMDSAVIASGDNCTALYDGEGGDGITVTGSTIAAFGADLARPAGSSSTFLGGVIHADGNININNSAVFFRGGADTDPYDFIMSYGTLDETSVIYVAWDETAFATNYTDGSDIIFNGSISDYDDMFMTILKRVDLNNMDPSISLTHVTDPYSRFSTTPGVAYYFEDSSGVSHHGAFPFTHIPNLKVNYNVIVYGNSGNPTVFGPYFPGQSVSITAPPAPAGESFIRWADTSTILYQPGDAALTRSTLTFTMPPHYYIFHVEYTTHGLGQYSGGQPAPAVPLSPIEAALKSVEEAQPGDTVAVTLSGSGIIQGGQLLNAMAGKDVTVEITVGGNTWVINGLEVPPQTSGFDMSVQLGTNAIPQDVLDTLPEAAGALQLTLGHAGPFGFTMSLLLPLGAENAGRLAILYYFNPETMALELVSSAVIDDQGNALLPFSHASEYLVVVGEEAPVPVAADSLFADVSADDWFYDDVAHIVRLGLMNGVSDTAFAPHSPMTRGMLVTVLWRMEGMPSAAPAGFGDVAEGAYYGPAVAWAAENGIVLGVGGPFFGPERPLTREETATILARYLAFKGVTPEPDTDSLTFADSDTIDSWAAEAVDIMSRLGVILGKDGGRFDPHGPSTRAEVAAMLHRLSGFLAE